jgi:dihydrofolate synthase / folylpolyglutamate synthase
MTTGYEAALAAVASRLGQGIKPGLDRIGALLDALAAPQEGYPIVHVAGTNGKTSTVRMIGALAGAHGLATGSFTSPELEDVEDQFGYGGGIMTRDEFARAVGELDPIARLVDDHSGDTVTSFEMLTALAFSWFAERSVDLAVVEAGLGGRDDATNAARSEVAVLTSVGIEHTSVLGDSLEEIAAHKVGILDESASLVTGPLDPAVARVVRERVSDRGARWFRFGDDFMPDDLQRAVGGWVFDIEGVHGRYTELGLRLRGRHQVGNFTVAVAAVEALLGRELDEAGVREAASSITVPGRMETMATDPIVMLDAAHNPDGVTALVAALTEEFPTTRWAVVIGAMADKDIGAMLSLLAPITASVVSTAAATARALPAADLAATARTLLEVPVVPSASVHDAVTIARAAGIPVLVTGSVAVVGEARTALRRLTGNG